MEAAGDGVELCDIEESERGKLKQSKRASRRMWEIVNREVIDEEFKVDRPNSITKDIGGVNFGLQTAGHEDGVFSDPHGADIPQIGKTDRGVRCLSAVSSVTFANTPEELTPSRAKESATAQLPERT